MRRAAAADRGAMRTNRSTTQIRLAGQAAAADGPLDLTMMYVMHHAFRRDLAAFAVAAERTSAADKPAWRALVGRWDLFTTVLHHHHRGEDAGIWPLLAVRVPPEDRATLEAMEAEHGRIDPLLRRVDGFLRDLARPATLSESAGRVQLVDALRCARDLLDTHLAHEEEQAIPLMQHYIRPEEMDRVERLHFRRGLSPRQVLATVPWALDGLPDGVRESALDLTGPAYRLAWAVTRRRFARRDALALS